MSVTTGCGVQTMSPLTPGSASCSHAAASGSDAITILRRRLRSASRFMGASYAPILAHGRRAAAAIDLIESIIPCSAGGSFQDRVFVVMEFVDGRTLAAWLVESRRSWREILDVFVQAGQGLAAAHAAGLVHRDFKPEKVL